MPDASAPALPLPCYWKGDYNHSKQVVLLSIGMQDKQSITIVAYDSKCARTCKTVNVHKLTQRIVIAASLPEGKTFIL